MGVLAAWGIDKLVPLLKIQPCQECKLSEMHLVDDCRCLHLKEVIEHFKKLSFVRFLLLVILTGAIAGFFTGIMGEEDWNWIKVTFISLIVLAGMIIITVPDHYLEEHVWKHIAREHLWRIFLWTFGTLFFIDLALHAWNLELFVKEHIWGVIVVAALLGLIPESGSPFDDSHFVCQRIDPVFRTTDQFHRPGRARDVTAPVFYLTGFNTDKNI